MSFLEPAAALPTLRSFHNGASFLIRQFGPAIGGSSIIGFCKPSYDAGNSSGARLNLRYPSPSAGTYRPGNGPNVRLSYRARHFPIPGCTHADTLIVLPNQQYIVR